MKFELCCDNNCLDLPSLIQVQGNGWCIHRFMGYVILESMIWFDLIWIDIPKLTEYIVYYGYKSFEFTADLQTTSTFPFHSFHFHILDAHALEKVIREMPKKWDVIDSGYSEDSEDSDCSISSENWISLTRWKKKIKFCHCQNRCLLDCNQFNHSANPIAREFHPVWQMRIITLSFSFISFSSFINCCKQANFKHLSTFLLFNNPQNI